MLILFKVKNKKKNEHNFSTFILYYYIDVIFIIKLIENVFVLLLGFVYYND